MQEPNMAALPVWKCFNRMLVPASCLFTQMMDADYFLRYERSLNLANDDFIVLIDWPGA